LRLTGRAGVFPRPSFDPKKGKPRELKEQYSQVNATTVDQILPGLWSAGWAGQADDAVAGRADERLVSSELDVQGIWKSFGDVEVLKDVSFSVRSGEFVTLLGPSGCGKTTLLRIIAGLELQDHGDVVLGGRSITGLPANQRPVNTVFQSYALFPHLNVSDNIAFGLRSRKYPPMEVARRVRQALEMLRLADMHRRYAHQLSGGEKQRVALARALVNEPELLLLDEPMSALDAKLRVEVQLELRRLQRALGKTFVLVTHDQNEAMTVSDRVIVMRAGCIEQCGTPSQVYERPVNRFVAEFLGSANLIPGSRCNGSVHTVHGSLVTNSPPAWDHGTLAIRPERIRVSRQKPEVNAVCGRVQEVIYRGDHMDMFLEPGSLRVRTTPMADLFVGQMVWLELAPEYLVALID
jgi:spermidine/putrescine transport system ATP-binding protein